jgi:hypothetical protein
MLPSFIHNASGISHQHPAVTHRMGSFTN